ncbi:MAG: hypothetical protein AAF738_01385 [Bacteroidota bacterium]
MAKTPSFRAILVSIPAPLRNRYVLVAILFLTWMLFFDKHDIFTQTHLYQTNEQLKADKVYYEQEIIEIRRDKRDLDLNREKFAREKYFMKRADEDVFVIVEQ